MLVATRKFLFEGTAKKLFTSVRCNSSISCEEVRIPVPWGHVAGKFWGPQDKKPILTLHGWQDNCNSFDYLIPLLPKHLSYLCIDSPGHGYSSQIPQGMFYHGVDGVFIIRRIQEYFKWKTISLMGHSLGAITSYTYSFIHPDMIDFIICIDGLQPLINPGRVNKMRTTIDEFFKYDQQNRDSREPPCYTIEEMAERLHKGTRKSISLGKCEHLLRRNIKESKTQPGKYYFSRDNRLKCGPLNNWSIEDLQAASKQVNYPIFLSIAEETPFFSNLEPYTQTFENLKKATEHFELHKVKGTHHQHFNAPEEIAGLISKFIMKHDKVDRSVGYNLNDVKAC